MRWEACSEGIKSTLNPFWNDQGLFSIILSLYYLQCSFVLMIWNWINGSNQRFCHICDGSCTSEEVYVNSHLWMHEKEEEIASEPWMKYVLYPWIMLFLLDVVYLERVVRLTAHVDCVSLGGWSVKHILVAKGWVCWFWLDDVDVCSAFCLECACVRACASVAVANRCRCSCAWCMHVKKGGDVFITAEKLLMKNAEEDWLAIV